MNKFILSFLILVMSYNTHAAFREVWGRYFLVNNIKGDFNLITNFDMALDTQKTNLSYWSLRSTIFYLIGKGWFADVGALYRSDFSSNVFNHELRFIGSIHNVTTVGDFSFRSRLRGEKRWIKKDPFAEFHANNPFRLRLRLLGQKNHLFDMQSKFFFYTGPELFIEQNISRDKKLDLGSVRWWFGLGRVISKTLAVEIDYWYRQYVNQTRPNFGSIILRFNQII
ncbi:MAG: hypothetical protein DRQ89_00095 [Epsilonproteobacteria bacterium]|nr:MAG: hypothetical protein DRQ89_00095 [Campylobacterota bacterium]